MLSVMYLLGTDFFVHKDLYVSILIYSTQFIRWPNLSSHLDVVTREERTCLHSEGGVDDEEHFLWACTTHDSIREELFRKLETHNSLNTLLALRTPANRRPAHAIKWVMQYGF